MVNFLQYMPSAEQVRKAYARRLQTNRDWKRRQTPEKRRALRRGRQSVASKFANPWSYTNDKETAKAGS